MHLYSWLSLVGSVSVRDSRLALSKMGKAKDVRRFFLKISTYADFLLLYLFALPSVKC